MQYSNEQLLNRLNLLGLELYHSGKSYIASIYNDNKLVTILKVIPKDKYEDNIRNIAALMSIFMSQNKEPIHIKISNTDLICSFIYRKDNEYLFITKREKPYIFPEELICKKYNIEPTKENQQKIKVSIERRVYSYKDRDLQKSKRCITFEEAEKLDDYLLNTIYFDLYNEDDELQKLRHLSGKKICDLTLKDKMEVSKYITNTTRPVLLYKSPGDSKLLVNTIPIFETSSYKDLCDLIIINEDKCSYCNSKLSLLDTKYSENGLTFDAKISLYGHRKDNITLCCSLCNSKKTYKNKLDI
jgi:hypothetical protein